MSSLDTAGHGFGVRIRLLGPVGATVEGEEIDLGGPKERTLLALLAASPASSSSSDRLIDAMWGEEPPGSAKKTLQTYVSHLRKAFTPTDVIATGPGGYALLSIARTDVEEVEARMASALRAHGGLEPGARVALLGDALEAFEGTPLSGTAPSVLLDSLAESYSQLRWSLVEELATARVSVGDDPTLIADLHRWVDENPHRERLWVQLMLELYRAGRQGESLATFQRARKHLLDGLGVEPGPELRDLESAILRQDPDLLIPTSRPAIPTPETLTFLFTDIEQSTVRWDLEPEPMRAALALHDEILTDCIEANQGRVFAAGGDGFGAAFASPVGAAQAAASAQIRLRTVKWPTSVPLHVRMGLNTGIAENRGGDFFGAPVNRAARVMDAGHGRQVLCSAATAALLGDDPVWSARLSFIAECRLRGLERPARLHQLSPDADFEEFAPLRTSLAPTRVLPAPLDSLHGRDDELAELRAVVADHRLVTLTGVGGTGKTRLALELALGVREAFAGGVVWVELAASDRDGIDGAIARAIGLSLTGAGEGHAAQIVAALERQRVLLVLDNCEHLLGVAAQRVLGLLQGGPAISVLTTSREPLGVAGERIYVVPSLGLPGRVGVSASEEMLRARAASAGATIADDEHTADAIRRICERLDGVPLALEFAAAQLTTHAAPQLVERLDDHFRLLGRPGRGAVQRQQTIESTIEWSYRLLDEAERSVLDRLAVFQGGFDLAAAESVAGHDLAPGEGAAIVDQLHWKSMVTVDSATDDAHTRFKLLEPVRQFAHARLRMGGELEATLERHADHFLQLLARPTSGDRFVDEGARTVIAFENRGNVELAQRTLILRPNPTDALMFFDSLKIQFALDTDTGIELAHLIGPLLEGAAPTVAPPVIGNACNSMALVEQMDFRAAAMDWARRARSIAVETGDETLLAESDFHLGTQSLSAGQVADAERYLRDSCSLHDALGNEATLAYNLCWYSWTLVVEGRSADAEEPARRGYELACRDSAVLGLVAPLTAAVLAHSGDHAGAARVLEEIRGAGQQGHMSWGAAAAVEIERMDLAVDEVRAALELGFGSALRDSSVCLVAATVFDRLGELDLMAIWVAATLGCELRVASRDGSPSNLAVSNREILGPLLDLEDLVNAARRHLGSRFDELVKHYGATTDIGPVRETIRVLDGHAARLAETLSSP